MTRYSRFSHTSAARLTLAGAVPPSLVRELTEASVLSTENTSAVILVSTACRSARERLCRRR